MLINAAFFSTGNIASVASFEISSVYRFTTRFNPFLMGGLLMLKVLIPMITVAVAFLALLKLQRVSSFQVYLIFIALSDLMAARFFFQVTTEGSWQDIGMSISRYALMGTQVVTILVFLGLADMYTHKLPVNGIAAVRRGDAKKHCDAGPGRWSVGAAIVSNPYIHSRTRHLYQPRLSYATCGQVRAIVRTLRPHSSSLSVINRQ